MRRMFMMALTLIVPLTLAGPAVAKEPTGDFSVFKQCPRFTSGVESCIYAQTFSGEVVLNKQPVPITNTITLQGGAIHHENGTETFVGALNGETLSKSPQKVPGGLLGLVRCNEIKGNGFLEKVARAVCEAVFENRLTGVNATAELARPASEIGINSNNLFNREGVALSLPVKIHLENALLGSECYVGSSASPVMWNLTTGTTSPPAPNQPISGKVGHIEFKDESNFVEITNNTLVDNAYSAPGATGCGGVFSFLIDPLIDSKIGLPSSAGHNTTILNGTIKEATAEAVINSEK